MTVEGEVFGRGVSSFRVQYRCYAIIDTLKEEDKIRRYE